MQGLKELESTCSHNIWFGKGALQYLVWKICFAIFGFEICFAIFGLENMLYNIGF